MVKITLDGTSKEIVSGDNSCLLMSMEAAGFPVLVGCISGMCEVCKLTLVSGKENLVHIETPMLELSENEVLPCCVVAQGEVELSSL